MKVAHHAGRGIGIDDAARLPSSAAIAGTIRSCSIRTVDGSGSSGGRHSRASLVRLERLLHGRCRAGRKYRGSSQGKPQRQIHQQILIKAMQGTIIGESPLRDMKSERWTVGLGVIYEQALKAWQMVRTIDQDDDLGPATHDQALIAAIASSPKAID